MSMRMLQATGVLLLLIVFHLGSIYALESVKENIDTKIDKEPLDSVARSKRHSLDTSLPNDDEEEDKHSPEEYRRRLISALGDDKRHDSLQYDLGKSEDDKKRSVGSKRLNFDLGKRYNFDLGKRFSNWDLGKRYSNWDLGKRYNWDLGKRYNWDLGKRYNWDLGKRYNWDLGKRYNWDLGKRVSDKRYNFDLGKRQMKEKRSTGDSPAANSA